MTIAALRYPACGANVECFDSGAAEGWCPYCGSKIVDIAAQQAHCAATAMEPYASSTRRAYSAFSPRLRARCDRRAMFTFGLQRAVSAEFASQRKALSWYAVRSKPARPLHDAHWRVFSVLRIV